MDFIPQLSARIGLADVKMLVALVPTDLLMQYIHHPDRVVSNNAAWVMTHKPDSEIRTLPQDEIIDIILTTTQVTLRRLCLNLVDRQIIAAESIRTDFLDFCLLHMTLPDEPVGVQALCMKLARRMCAFYPELEQEFQQTLRLMHAEHYKPGLVHLIKKFLIV